MLLAVFVVFVFTGTAYAAPNQQINYQGKLLDSAAIPVTDAAYSIEFSLYTAPTGGSNIWTETNSVDTVSGLFSVMLGSSTSLAGVDFNQTLYLGINVASDGEMSPRKILGTVPAAFQAIEASNAVTFDNIATTSFLRSDQADIISASEASTLLTVTQNGAGDILNLFDGGTEVFSVLDGGNIGIGTTSPSYALSIAGDAIITGALYDSTNSAGTNGFVLQTTGSATSWVATSTLGFGTGDLSATDIDTSAELAAILTDETGFSSGALSVFSISPTITGIADFVAGDFSSTLTMSGSAANIALGSNFLSGDGGDEGIFVDSDGDVGIGTTTPTAELDVETTGTDGIEVTLYSASADTLLRLDNPDGSIAGGSEFIQALDAGVVMFEIDGTGYLQNYANAIFGRRPASTDSTTRTVTIGGARSSTGNDFARLDFQNYDTESGAVEYTGARISSQNDSGVDSGDLRFFTASGGTLSSEQMIITTDGDIGIGTTSPASKLTVWGGFEVGTSSTPAFMVDTTTGRVAVGTSTEDTTALFSVYNGDAEVLQGSLTEVGSVDIGGNPEKLFPYKNYLFALRDGNTISAVDTSDPENPVSVSSLAVSSSITDGTIHGDYLYVAHSGLDIMTIYNIEDPANFYQVATTTIGSAPLFNGPNAVTAVGNYLYVSLVSQDAVEVFDISNPESPLPVTYYDDNNSTFFFNGVSYLVAQGDRLHVINLSATAGYATYDISDPLNMTLLTHIESNATNGLSGTDAMEVDGDYVYVGTSIAPGKIVAIDVSNRSSSTIASVYDDTSDISIVNPVDMFVSGKYLYVTSQGAEDRYSIIDVSDPTNLREVASGAAGANPNGIVLGKDGYLYIANSTFHDIDVYSTAGVTAPSANIGNLLASQIYTGDLSVNESFKVTGNTFFDSDIYASGRLMLRGTASSTDLTPDTAGLTVMRGGLTVGTTSILYGINSVLSGASGYFGIGDTTAGEYFAIDGSGNVGIGTTSPSHLLSIAGDVIITGALYDSTNSAGTNGFVLQTTGSGTSWVATSSLGISSGSSVSFGTDNQIPFTNSGGTDFDYDAAFTFDGSEFSVDGSVNIADTSLGYEIGGLRMFYAATTSNSIMIGEDAGMSMLSDGTNNIAVGARAMEDLTTGDFNIAIGNRAGRTLTGSDNIIIGRLAGDPIAGGDFNTLIGNSSGRLLNGGDANAFFGFESGYNSTSTSRNTAVGAYALRGGAQNVAQYNTVLGYQAGYSIETGADNNILLGYQAGNSLTTGANNIALGYDIELPSNTASNQLNIGNLIFSEGIDGTGTTLSSGNIGIGTTTPLALLTVGSAAPTIVDGTNDLFVTDDIELGGTLYGPTAARIGTASVYTELLSTGLQYANGTGNADPSITFSGSSILYDASDGTAGGSHVFTLDSTTFMTINNGVGAGAYDSVSIGNTDYGASLSVTHTSVNGYSFLVEDEASDTSPFVIDIDGNVGVGTSTPDSLLHLYGATGVLTIEDTDSRGNLSLFNSSLAPAADTELGKVNFKGNDGGGNETGYAQIRGYVADNTNGAEDGYLTFTTTQNGSSLEVMRLDALGNVGIGTTSPESILTIDNRSLTGDVTAGVTKYIGLTNSTLDAVQYGDRSYIDISSTATSTVVGGIVRLADNTTLGNTVRGFEVQAFRGANTQGENTALSGFARTFGVRGKTEGDAGGVFEPAGGFFETGGTTQGNAIRGYSDSITTADLLSLYQEDSAFTGTGLLMNFGNDTGSFASTSSKFVDFQNAGTSKFTVTAHGTTTIGDGTTGNQAGLQIGYGGLCVDNDGSCVASTTGRISSVSTYTGNSDLAEMYFSSDDLVPGEIVMADGFISVERATKDSEAKVLGVVSTKPGLLLGSDDTSLVSAQKGYPLALTGRVPVRLSDENGDVAVGDPLTLSSLPGIAMKATEADEIVGYALEAFDGRYAYTEGYVNQFGDDIAEPNYEALNVNTEANQTDGCHFGGGGVVGATSTEVCDPETVIEQSLDDGPTDEEIAQARYEVEQEALDALRTQSAETYSVEGETVKVGSVTMFVDRGYNLLASQTDILNELVSTDTDLVLGAEEGSDETLWSRLKVLAQGFVDGVLTITGITTELVKSDKVETQELCVDDVCITADDLRALLLQSNDDGQVVEVNNEEPEDTPLDEGDTTEQDDTTENETPSEDTSATSTDDIATSTEEISDTENDQEETATSTQEVVDESEPVEDPEVTDKPLEVEQTEDVPAEEDIEEEPPPEPEDIEPPAEPPPEPAEEEPNQEPAT